MKQLNTLAFGTACAAVSAVTMLLISLASAIGIYKGAATIMHQIHMFYIPDLLGTITGMIEAALFSFLAGALFAWVYNQFSK